MSATIEEWMQPNSEPPVRAQLRALPVSAALVVGVLLIGCGRSDQEVEQRAHVEVSTPAAKTPDSGAERGPYSPAIRGANWFCRTVVLFYKDRGSGLHTGSCFSSLADCNAFGNMGPGERAEEMGVVSRIQGRCEEYPIAYCFLNNYLAKKPGPVDFGGHPELFCQTDVVLCRAERDREVEYAARQHDPPPGDCFPTARQQ